jgi:hypothetical protein
MNSTDTIIADMMRRRFVIEYASKHHMPNETAAVILKAEHLFPLSQYITVGVSTTHDFFNYQFANN